MRGKAGVRPDVRVGEALAGAARDILREARDALDDRARPDAAAVHQYRKDMKRWRAMLRLLAPFLGPDGEGLQRQARDLARELAPARDAQAALDALADLGKAEPGLPAAVTKALRGRIEKLRANETTALDDGVRQKLGGALDAAELAAEHWPVDRVGVAELAAALAAGYRRARKAVPPDFSAASAEKLHETARPPSRPRRARRAHRGGAAARALARALKARDRGAAGHARRRRGQDRRPAVRREAEGVPQTARGADVGESVNRKSERPPESMPIRSAVSFDFDDGS